MDTQTNQNPSTTPRPAGATPGKDYQIYYFSELRDRKLFRSDALNGGKGRPFGKVADLVFKVAEPYPEALGILVDHGWGQETEFIPWAKVVHIEAQRLIVNPPDPPEVNPGKDRGGFAPFVDQAGWVVLEDHLIGKTILDMDGRRTEVVNDVHLLASGGRMLLIHVDISFNGFLRKWHLYRLFHGKDQLISWRYVQPLSLEDAVITDRVSLSVTRDRIKELPPEDLADALEELSGHEQQALFSALEPETAAETLVEAEPRTQRQLIADLRQERARKILQEMSVPQLADLFSVLPHEDSSNLMGLLPPEQLTRIQAMLSEREATALTMVNSEYIALPKESLVGAVLTTIRTSGKPHEAVSYVYVINPADRLLLGVVDLRDLVLATDTKTLGEIMVAPVVSADSTDTRDDLAELFAKYHFRMLPVVDRLDHLLGVVHYNDIMRGTVTRVRV